MPSFLSFFLFSLPFAAFCSFPIDFFVLFFLFVCLLVCLLLFLFSVHQIQLFLFQNIFVDLCIVAGEPRQLHLLLRIHSDEC